MSHPADEGGRRPMALLVTSSQWGDTPVDRGPGPDPGSPPLGGRPRTEPDRVSGGTACVSRRDRRSFEQTVQLLELFLHREGRAPAARETIRVDGDTVKIGAWLAKARTKHRTGQLPEGHVRLVAALFDGDWTTEAAVPAPLA